MPETLWCCKVKEFGPLIVSIDAQGRNLFEENKVIFNEKKEAAKQDINPEEKKKLVAELQREGVKIIASSHDFDKTDSHEILLDRFREMEKSGADILKMAVMPHGFEDVAAIMEATNAMRKECEKPLVSMAMGSIGSISRISGENFGSGITFGTVGAASAPGQFPIGELRSLLEALHQKNLEA